MERLAELPGCIAKRIKSKHPRHVKFLEGEPKVKAARLEFEELPQRTRTGANTSNVTILLSPLALAE